MQSQNTDSLLIKAKYELDNKNYEVVLKEYKPQIQFLSNRNQNHLNYIVAQAFQKINKADSAYIFYTKALNGYRELEDYESTADINIKIYSVLKSQKHLSENSGSYFQDFFNYAKETQSKKWLALAYNFIAIDSFSQPDYASSKNFFLKSLSLYDQLDSLYAKANILSNLGVLYTNRIQKFDSARIYLSNALELVEKDSLHQDYKNLKFNILNNTGNSYRFQEDFTNALKYYHLAERININQFPLNSKRILYSNIEKSLSALNKTDSAYIYLKKIKAIEEEINLTKQNTLISEIKEKYDNEKLRADNLEAESRRIRNRNLLLIAISIILLGTVISFMSYKSVKRKQKIAEQEREIEIQKKEKLLKNQELASIDAMLDGQEKERQRLASELHDSVGATLTAAKLQFDYIAKQSALNSDHNELYETTKNLLEQAYKEVRSMAHLKNSGVIAKQGLLPALKNLAKSASNASELNIEVNEFGLNTRLENALEITLFRIIQELITNVIKHSEAKEAVISLTQIDNTINIIVEDNGKGFNAKKIQKQSNGMGLGSIERRVESLNGSMEIDSTIGKGTSILIDIPL